VCVYVCMCIYHTIIIHHTNNTNNTNNTTITTIILTRGTTLQTGLSKSVQSEQARGGVAVRPEHMGAKTGRCHMSLSQNNRRR
jgi:hypothetical protein